jgi:hypothetical protein
MSLIAFVLGAAVSVLFLTAFKAGKLDFKLPALNQIGDSSLSPSSVNWLGAIAFIGACLICLI